MSNIINEKELNEFLINEELVKEQDCEDLSFEEEAKL